MRVDGKDFRTIWLNADGAAVDVIDQTKLPHRFEVLTLRSSTAAADAHQADGRARRAADRRDRRLRHGAALRPTPSDAGLAARLRRCCCDAARRRSICAGRSSACGRSSPPCRPRSAARPPIASRALIADDDVAACEAIGENGRALIEDVAAAQAPGFRSTS